LVHINFAGDNIVVNITKILLIMIFTIVIGGCSAKNPIETPGVTVMVQTPIQSAYPYPIEEPTVPVVTSSYPGPLGGSGIPEVVSTPMNYVTQLIVPTPLTGKAVVTGVLLIGGEGGKPYMATLYLASTVPPSTPDYPPLIAFSEQSDQLGIQDVDTGRFLFTNVAPGQYAIIIWTPFGGNPLVDQSGNSLLFTVKAGEVKDLGIIPIK
jgi:hypothetical protein